MAQHRKTAHRRERSSARHRKPPRRIPTTKVAAAAAGAVIVTGGVAQAVTHGPWLGQSAALNRAGSAGQVVPGRGPASGSAAAGHDATSSPGLTHDVAGDASDPQPRPHQGLASPSPSRRRSSAAKPKPTASPTPSPTAAGYANPLRAVSGLIAERIDMGVDFGGSGPVYAIGDAVVTNASGDDAGWPGGGWITYRLTSGPADGLTVYVAEDVTPAVAVGQQVTSSTVIATMYNGGAGIETGWAQPGGASAESQLAEAGGISGGGPFPTVVGLNFEELLQGLGVPAANNRAYAAYGLLPPGYPATWPAS